MNQALRHRLHPEATAFGDPINQPDGRTGHVALNMRRAPDGRSFIAHQHATYPFHICRPNYVGGDPSGMATLYLQSIAGGLFEHDRLTMELAVEDSAAIHLTSQGATVVHSMSGGQAVLATALSAGPSTIVEILPEATILFPGAHLEYRTEICADESAVVCVGESVIAHDPQGNDALFDMFISDVLFRASDGRILAHDRQSAKGAAFREMSLSADKESGRFNTYGGIHLWAPKRDLAELVSRLGRELPELSDAYAGASRLPNNCGLTVRILARDGAAMRAAWNTTWQAVRHELFDAPAPRRRK